MPRKSYIQKLWQKSDSKEEWEKNQRQIKKLLEHC